MFHILRASAGSGKTFALVRHYLRLVLPQPQGFRHVLAITFTNKATAEMKRRIVSALAELARGEGTALAQVLRQDLPGLDLQRQAQQALTAILHQYADFSVQTIESFFYGIVRAFQRELELHYGAELELDVDPPLDFAIDALLEQVGEDAELTAWLTDYIQDKMDQDKGWYIDGSVRALAKQLFHEDVARQLEQGTLTVPQAREVAQTLRDFVQRFREESRQQAQAALDLLEQYSLEPTDLAYGGAGVGGWLRAVAAGQQKGPGERAMKAVSEPYSVASKSSPNRRAIEECVDAGLTGHIQGLVAHYQTHGPMLEAVLAIQRQLYVLPLLSQLQARLKQYRDENRVMLMADVGRALESVVTEQDAPFLYEKTGTRYHHFLLDEFQDTSRRQWTNLRPLIQNALGSGNEILVVGDAKQSIYRFRAGDMALLLGLEDAFPTFREVMRPGSLTDNWRSGGRIVQVNNRLFPQAAALLARELDLPEGSLLHRAYLDGSLVQQPAPHRAEDGYVEMTFLPPDAEDARGMERWKGPARTALLAQIQGLLAEGFVYRDLAILVRKNREGTALATFLLENRLPVISSESLQIAESPAVQTMLSAFQVLAEPGHGPARLHLAQAMAQVGASLPGILAQPAAVVTNLDRLRTEWLRLPLYELGERVLHLLGLHERANLYLLRLLDVLLDYQRKEGGDVAQFLGWWEAHAHEISVEVGEDADAIQIITLHKAKGLEFPVVLMPYGEWEIVPRHSATLWAQVPEGPFPAEQALPFDSRSEWLDGNPLAPYHAQELIQAQLDNLNLLYVALTRPAQRLYLWTPLPKDSEKLSSVSQLLHAALSTDPELQTGLDDNVFRWGQPQAPWPQPLRSAATVLRPTRLPVHVDWRNRITIRRRAVEWAGLPTRRLDSAAYGKLVHEALARLKQKEDVPHVLDRLQFEGLLQAAEAPALATQLQAVLAHAEIAPFFESGWEVLAEAELWLPAEYTFVRPDRVLLGASRTVVLDFKSGLPETAHQKQVRQYGLALVEMGYPDVEAYLVYVAGPSLIRVALQSQVTSAA